jgi:hypothetical protein
MIYDSSNDPVFFSDSGQNKVARPENHAMGLGKWWYGDGYQVNLMLIGPCIIVITEG